MKLRGNNELRLNQATMIDIVQLWITRSTSGHQPPIVKSVTYSSNPNVFVVSLTEAEPEIEEEEEEDEDDG